MENDFKVVDLVYIRSEECLRALDSILGKAYYRNEPLYTLIKTLFIVKGTGLGPQATHFVALAPNNNPDGYVYNSWALASSVTHIHSPITHIKVIP